MLRGYRGDGALVRRIPELVSLAVVLQAGGDPTAVIGCCQAMGEAAKAMNPPPKIALVCRQDPPHCTFTAREAGVLCATFDLVCEQGTRRRRRCSPVLLEGEEITFDAHTILRSTVSCSRVRHRDSTFHAFKSEVADRKQAIEEEECEQERIRKRTTCDSRIPPYMAERDPRKNALLYRDLPAFCKRRLERESKKPPRPEPPCGD